MTDGGSAHDLDQLKKTVDDIDKQVRDALNRSNEAAARAADATTPELARQLQVELDDAKRQLDALHPVQSQLDASLAEAVAAHAAEQERAVRQQAVEQEAARKAAEEQAAQQRAAAQAAERQAAEKAARDLAERSDALAAHMADLAARASAAQTPQEQQAIRHELEDAERQREQIKQLQGALPAPGPSETKPDKAGNGFKIAAAIGAVVVAVVVGTVAVVANGGSDGNKSGSTPAAASEVGDLGPDHALDGHWVLIDGLDNTYIDMGLSCSHICDQPGAQLTIDKSSVTIDISGDRVTGGIFKTGYSSSTGDPCTIIESRVDATVSGGVDPVKAYGQLIVDGTEVRKSGCDSNSQQVVTKPTFHTSRFFFVRDDTLTVCYNIDPNTFDSCNTNGLSAARAEVPSGIAATFKRG